MPISRRFYPDLKNILIRRKWLEIKIAIIDTDLVGKKKHRFPNLGSMKLSG